MGNTELLLLKLAAVLFIGFIGGQVVKLLKLPNVSGYLVFGLLLGPSVGLIIPGFEGIITPADQSSLKFLSEIALAFIAFSIGSEFNIKSIKKSGKEVSILTAFEVFGAVALVFLLMLIVPKPQTFQNSHGLVGYNPFTKPNIAFSMILASMSAATAPAATLMVIRQYRAYGPVTKAILPITALDDIFGIIIFGFFISIAQILVPAPGAREVHVALMIAKPFIEVLGSILIGTIIGYVLSVVGKRFDRERDDIQILAVGSVILSIGLISLLNSENVLGQYGISFSPLLSNIMTGAMVANLTRRPARTFNAVNDFTTPFYIVFFTMAGASLNLGIIRTEWLIAIISIVYIIARGAGKYFGIYVGATVAGSNENIKKNLGMALLPQGGVSIGLLVIVSTSMASMYPVISTIIMLSVLVYETSGPIFAKLAISRSGEIDGLDKLDQLSSVDDLVPQTEGE